MARWSQRTARARSAWSSVARGEGSRRGRGPTHGPVRVEQVKTAAIGKGKATRTASVRWDQIRDGVGPGPARGCASDHTVHASRRSGNVHGAVAVEMDELDDGFRLCRARRGDEGAAEAAP